MLLDPPGPAPLFFGFTNLLYMKGTEWDNRNMGASFAGSQWDSISPPAEVPGAVSEQFFRLSADTGGYHYLSRP